VCVKSMCNYKCGDIILVSESGISPSFSEDAVIGNVLLREYTGIPAVVPTKALMPKKMTILQQLDNIIEMYPHLLEESNHLENVDFSFLD
jgi:hypothetical protein